MDIIRFTYKGKNYRLTPWFNTAVNGAIFGTMVISFSMIFLGLFL